MSITITIDKKKLPKYIETLQSRLKSIQKEIEAFKKELKKYEEKYKLTTSKFVKLYEKAMKAQVKWFLPPQADIDSIDWYAQALKLKELKEEASYLKELINKLKQKLLKTSIQDTQSGFRAFSKKH